MKNKQINKSLKGKTGKDLLGLIETKKKPSFNVNGISPSGDIEIALSGIWKSLLGHDSFGADDDFFFCGGNSLKAIHLISKISREFKVQIELTEIFLYPTIGQLAELIKKLQKSKLFSSKINVQPKPELIPLSFSQERLWFVHQLEGSLQYHVSAVLNLKGILNTEALNYALQQVIKRHEVLRTVIREKEGQGYQYVIEADGWDLSIIDGTKLKNNDKQLRQFIQQLINQPFDISKDYMLRAAVISTDDKENTLIVTMHHIASDAWSMSILVKEVIELYNSYEEGRPAKLEPLQLQYSDYAIWQRKYLNEESLNQKLEYWKEKFEGAEPLKLPTDYRRPAVRNVDGSSENFSIDKELSDKIQNLSQQNGSTLFMTLLAAFKILLHRYSGQQDITVGTSIVNRSHQEVEDLVGFFVNTLAFRNSVSSNTTFVNLLHDVRQTVLDAYSHQDVPFEKVVEATVKERDPGRSPLFQVMLVMNNAPEVSGLHLGEAELSEEPFEDNISKFDITFFLKETDAGLQGLVQYRTDLFTGQTMKRMVNHFKEILNSVVKYSDKPIGLLPILTQPEEHQLLKEFCSCEVKYPKDKSIVDLFEAQVKKTPDSPAVVFEGEQLSFQDLNERSNKLAHYLRSKEVKEGTLVPLFIEPGLDMIVGILGILKSGGAYVPVDTELPLNRIAFMLKDTGANVIVSNSKSSLKLVNGIDAEVIESDNEEINLQSENNLKSVTSPDQPAYVIYTSGSTGTPKGVMIDHKALVDYVFGLENKIKVSECTSFGLVSSIATDLGNTVLYSSLLTGGALHLFSKEMTSDVQKLHKYFDENKIDCLKIVPSHWKALRMEEKLLLPEKLLVFGGEALQTELVEKIRLSDSRCRVVNHYGPTETTIGKLLHVVDFNQKYDNTIPIGKPFSNTSVYVLTKDLTLCPVGIPGQLYIAGDGLARGYLNNQDLTNEKFVKNPFKKNSLMYATGDLVKFLPDGSIEFIGRADEQVKVRGYRIELSEIENAIQQSEFVKESVVLAREDKQGNKRLIGYIIAKEKFDKEKLTAYLKEKLPEYMIPALFVELEGFPITASGKIDRQSLPDPEVSEQLTNEYLAPRSEAETALAGIWMELLDLDKVGIHDNFFELGGDSIITIQLVSRARRAGYELQVGDVFTYQTIARLSALLEQRSDKLFNVSGEQSVLEGECGLLPVQQWYLEKDPKDVSYFNQSVLLSIDKTITQSILKRAFEQLTSHHDSLRFKYYKKDNTWHQAYAPEAEISEVKVVDLKTADKQDLKKLIAEHAGQYQKSLDIEKGELMKVVLIQTPKSEAQNRLLIIIHHLAIDGVSWRILLEDLEHIVSGLKEGGKTNLPAKSSSYRQWYETLEKYGQSERLNSQKEYWDCQIIRLSDYQIHKIEEKIEEKSKELIKIKDTANISMRLSSAETKKLIQEVPKTYHTEINDMLLSALAKTLCQYSGTDKVVIELEGHGRETIEEDVDTSRTVGWFTTHYPLKLEINKNENNKEGELIKSVKETLRRVPDKGIGYGVLKYINRESSLQDIKNPDIKFNYLGQTDNVLSSGKLFTLATEPTGASASEESIVSNRLTVNAIIQSGELILNWSYSKKHFNEKEIKSIVEAYQKNLESLITHCTQQQQKSGAIFTPSDYGLGKEISYEELDKFLNETYKGKPRKESIESIYRLSGLQQGMLFHGLYDEGESDSYIRQLSCDMKRVDIKILKKSWESILKNHSILRSAFYYDIFGIPVQCVYREVELPIEVLDYRNMNSEQQIAATEKYKEKDHRKGFDFKSVPLMRVGLIRLDEDSYKMIWTWHHLLFDGWSMQLLMEEFLNNYELHSTEKEPEIKEDDRYEDYIRYIERGDKQKEKIYWCNYMEGAEQSTLLPFIQTTTQRTKGIGKYKTLQLILDAEITAQAERFIQSNRVTINTLMQGIWSFLLHQYTGSRDVVYGVIVSGRPDDLPEVEKRVGMYINTLPLHSTLQKEKKVTDWLKEIQKEQVLSRQYQYTPLNEISGWTGIQGDLFDSIIVFENYPLSKLQRSLKIDNVQLNEKANYPLNLLISSSEQISIGFNFNTELLNEYYVQEIKNHFENVLRQIITNENDSLNEIELLTTQEKHQLLVDFNNTYSEYPKDKTIIDLFEEQVRKTTDNIAVVFEEEKLTYRELNERSNQLAHYLQSKGVKKETLVLICIERSIEMIVGILGILKAGGVYVPVDPEYPEERINYILEDTAASIVLSSKESSLKLPISENIDIIKLDEHWPEISKHSKDNLPAAVRPDNLAYIIYTSGSTGKPKGVMVEHYNVIRLFKTESPLFDFSEKDVWTLFHSYCFDFSVWEMYGALFYGGRLVIIPKHITKDASLFSELLISEKVSVLNQTPSAFYAMQEYLTDKKYPIAIRYIIFGGEALSPSKLQSWKELYPSCRLINMYGITETTVHVTYKEISMQEITSGKSVIGKPIPTLKAYVLNPDGRLLPVGVTGELYIAGDGVARGYLNHKKLTAEKFLNNPFSEEKTSKLYKTGDLGRWLADGSLEYMGRIDEQVKIRGYRIELGEVESNLRSIEGVKDAKVVLVEKNSPEDKRLNAYLQIENESLPLLSNYQYLLDKKQIQKSDLHVLPDGLPILGANQNEIKFLYNEIFEEHYYLKHGISLKKDSCVIDIGANVGFFTVFLNILSEDIKVYAFEPIPEVYNYLNANMHLYNVKGKSFELAVLDKEQDIEFVYYPFMSILSSITEDKDNVKEVVRSYIETTEDVEMLSQEIDSLLETKLESRKITCKAKTLSQIISEEKIKKIDLLKIDVENSEHLVLAGLAEDDWLRIESVIIEIHDVDGRLNFIKELLEVKGFTTHIEKEKTLSKDAILYNLYALRNTKNKGLDGLGDNEKIRKAGWQHPLEFRKNVKSEVEKKLPLYMVPSQIILLDNFPLTQNGKLDRKALPDPDASEHVSNEYSAPRNETERIMSEIWKDLLHVNRVGIHDNFFELGGDSIITIQVVSRARRFGFEFKPKDIFIHQTIASLSLVLLNGSEIAVISEQGLLTGSSGLLPIQQWYFEEADKSVSHFNQSVLLSIDKSVTPELLNQAIELLTFQHDALRFRYNKKDGHWNQEYGTVKSELISVDLKSSDKGTFGNLIKEHIEKYQRSLDIEKGEVIKFALIKTPESEIQNRIFIVIHHLAIDGVSWRILLDDLELILTGLSKEEKVDLGLKSSSYRQWYDALEQYGESKRLLSQGSYWEEIAKSYEPLIIDKAYTEVLRSKDMNTHTMKLDKIQTQLLLHEIPRVYHTEINDILLCGLALTLCEWTDREKITIGLEGHGRENISEGTDTSRTVGWFTNLYPVLIEIPSGKGVSDTIKSVKEQLRRVPDKGIGYGVLKYLNNEENLSGKECWDIVFNYLGQLDNVASSGKNLSIAPEITSGDFDEQHTVRHKLSVNGMVKGGELILTWSYSTRHYMIQTIEQLAERYQSTLKALIAHCMEQKKSGNVYTPSDYGLESDISYEELDKFLHVDDKDNIMSF